ncbi:MAG: PEGA domain-containing protein [Deltaproteobacteria bacterium]|nr:PEGA domain-containing protein [Deltaproteobacteria bacterium]
MRSTSLAAMASVLLLAGQARAQEDALELPDRVLIFLNQMSSADEEQQQTALLEVGNVLRERGIEFEVEADSTCTGTSDGCLRLAQDDDRADAVLILSVYHRGDEGSVDLQVFDGAMSGEGTQAWVGDPAAAAGQAARTALDSFRPETVTVTVAGTPEGATVWLGRRTGTLPLITTITPGEHRLRVSADGFITHTETVTIPATDTEWSHRVALEEGDDPDVMDDIDDSSSGGSGRGALIGLGATALVGGAATAVIGAILLARHGDCGDDGCVAEDGTILAGRNTRPAGAALLVIGAALAATGLGLTIRGARITPTASPDGAQLHLHTRF